ncbi:major facilitator superfamily domain-containing protein [Xylogone sp. PMI_703]|nr:major facilitator superfamily domain-containing protein [Xylogone sp. PMI_703]
MTEYSIKLKSEENVEKEESNEERSLTYEVPVEIMGQEETLSPSSASNDQGGNLSAKPLHILHEAIVIITLCGAQFMTQVGLGMAIAPLHVIGDSFGIHNAGELSWAAAAYSLTVSTFILIAGRLGDIYGHKLLFILGFLWFGLWSVIAGLSVFQGQILYDCCRAFQGIGAALFMPNAIAILGRIYQPGPRKGMAFALFGACAPGGIACVVFALGGYLVIPHIPPQKISGAIMARIDLPGSITGVVGLFLINFAWNQGPVVGWPKPYTYVLMIIGFVVMGLFTYIERHAVFPLVPSDVLTVETGFVLACVAAGWSSFGIWVFYSREFVEVLRGYSPVHASFQFLPATISGLIAAVTSGLIITRIPASFIMMAALLAFMIGNILVAVVPVEQSYWAQLFASILVMPWGMDMSFPAATILLSNAMHHEHQGTAASLVTTVINCSISVGLGMAGTIESQVDKNGTKILKGYRASWYAGIGLSGLGVIIASAFVISHWKSKMK